MKSFTAGPNENGVRLSRFVEGVTKDMPRSMMYKAFRNKRVKVNGKRAEPDTRLQTGDLDKATKTTYYGKNTSVSSASRWTASVPSETRTSSRAASCSSISMMSFSRRAALQ